MKAITGVATSVALFIGWSPSGPNDRALRLTSFADYARDYGGLDQHSPLGYSLAQFFDNGGSVAYVVRIADDDGAMLDQDDAAFGTALNALFEAGGVADRIDLLNIICVPGVSDAAAIRILQRRAVERRAFLIVDCADTDTVATIIGSLAEKTGADARNSALYFPWVTASDPLRPGTVRAFPPCGFVAGVLARTDAACGV